MRTGGELCPAAWSEHGTALRSGCHEYSSKVHGVGQQFGPSSYASFCWVRLDVFALDSCLVYHVPYKAAIGLDCMYLSSLTS